MGDNQKLYVILGPTASGKTSRAVGLAKYLDGEIISADSRQIYCGMDIGTGKDLQEYGDVRYHLIDICDAGYKYNLYEYLRDYQVAETDIKARGKAVVLCGGTGLYIESVLKGIRLPEVPENQRLREELKDKSLAELTEILASYKTLHNITDVDTAKRAIRAIEIQQYYQDNPEKAVTVSPNPITNAVVVGIDIPREKRRERITARLHKRLEDGMVDEIKHLIDSGVPADDLIYYGLEYKYITEYVIGHISYSDMVSQLEIAIHQFAKRQMTWFRGMERRGFRINWIPYDVSNQEFIEQVMAIQ